MRQQSFLVAMVSGSLRFPANYIAGANVLFRSVVADTQPVIQNTRVPFSAEGFLNSVSLMRGKQALHVIGSSAA